jgi:uncharacterized peroxidase-related enzyme
VKDTALFDAVIDGRPVSGLSDGETALLSYAVKLTHNPDSVTERDVRRLGEAGFSDRAVLDAALIIGYFNFVNRIALGLGVTHSPDEIKGYTF